MAKKSKKAAVPRELKRAGALCLAFANTGVQRRDDRRRNATAPPSMPLASYAEPVRWVVRMGALDGAVGERLLRVATERPADAAVAVAQASRLRSAVERIFTGRVLKEPPRPQELATVIELLQLRLPVAADGGFRWDWAGDDDALDLPLWPIAQSAAELLVSGDLDQVRQCITRGCYQLFIAGNRRRYWCDANTCGSRVRGKRYRDWMRRLSHPRKSKSTAEVQAELSSYKKRRSGARSTAPEPRSNGCTRR